MRRFLFPIAALSMAAVLPLVGCGSGNQLTAKVKGSVKHKGAPIKAGAVSYYHESLGVYNSVITKEGTYEIETLPAGNYNVTVDTNAYDPKRKQATYGVNNSGAGSDKGKRGGGGAGAGGTDKVNAKRQEKQKEERNASEKAGGYGPPPPKTTEELTEMFTKLDDKYVDRNKTPLKATLKNGKNEVNLDAD